MSMNLQKFAKVIDYKWLSLVLLLALLVCLALWRPWGAMNNGQRVVTVTGTTTLTAEPDKFVFSPSYEFKSLDKNTALNELVSKQAEVVKGLKAKGVADQNIKADSNGYRTNYYQNDDKEFVYTLTIQVTTGDKVKAQTIQDYLISTTPSGQVSAQPQFSQTKQKQLENKARDGAAADARRKADHMASNLGFKVGKIKSIQDGNIGNYPTAPMYSSSSSVGSVSIPDSEQTPMVIQPGQNEFNYSIQVEYYIR